MGTPVLAEVDETFRHYFHLPDLAPLHLTLATVVANYLDEDPVWLVLVAPPSSAKTELVSALGDLDDAFLRSTTTIPGLACYNAQSGKGGLLHRFRQRGNDERFGIIAIKEMGTMLAQAGEDRDRVNTFDALREVYDGRWSRELGTAGGVEIPWTGRAGLVAACTEVIDDYASVLASMGDRFLLYRFPAATREDRYAMCQRIVERGDPAAMRQRLAELVATFLAPHVDRGGLADLDDDANGLLAELAEVTSRARTHMKAEPRSNKVLRRPDPENPGRLFSVLRGLLRGLLLIGVEEHEAWRHVVDCAFSSLPKQRCAVMDRLVATPGALTVAQIVEACDGAGNDAVSWEVENLRAYGLVQRWSGAERAYRYSPTDEASETWGRFRPAHDVLSEVPPNVVQLHPPPDATAEHCTHCGDASRPLYRTTGSPVCAQCEAF